MRIRGEHDEAGSHKREGNSLELVELASVYRTLRFQVAIIPLLQEVWACRLSSSQRWAQNQPGGTCQPWVLLLGRWTPAHQGLLQVSCSSSPTCPSRLASSATCACRTPHLAVRREPRSCRPLVATRKSHRVQNGKHAVTGGGNTTMRLARKLVVSKRGLAIAEKGEESRSSASTPPPSTAPLSPEQIGALSNLAKSARKKGASLQPSRPPLPRWLPQSSKPLFFCQFASGRNCIPNESQPCYRECLRPQGLCL